MNKTTITNVEVDILVNSKPIKQYTHEGKIFIESKDGTEYSILVKNSNNHRIECVVGVDGIDVISGSQLTTSSTGYIIEAHSDLKLTGYRVSDEKVASFKFCNKDSSYAKDITTNAQNGIITVQCYNEKINYPTLNNIPYTETKPWSPWENPITTPWITFGGSTNDYTSTCNANSILRSANNVTCSVESTPSNHFSMGTTFGTAKDSKVKYVTFTRGIDLGTQNFYYTTRNNLKSIGVKMTNTQKIVLPVGIKYCTPPKNWKG